MWQVQRNLIYGELQLTIHKYVEMFLLSLTRVLCEAEFLIDLHIHLFQIQINAFFYPALFAMCCAYLETEINLEKSHCAEIHNTCSQR